MVTLVLFIFMQVNAQNLVQIEQQIIDFNMLGQFDQSAHLLDIYIERNTNFPYQQYKAYVLKADVYKALFDYKKTLENLDLALTAGLKSDKKEEVMANIRAEKSLAFFDTQDYAKAKVEMDFLKTSNYKYLAESLKAFVIMQDGYLEMKNKNYLLTEQKLDQAIVILKKFKPRNLPVAYGKKIELYSITNQTDKLLQAYDLGTANAKSFKMLKYEIYLNECLNEHYKKTKNWEKFGNLLILNNRLNKKYNASEHSKKLQLTEKNAELEQKSIELKNNQLIKYLLVVIIILLFLGLYLFIRLYKSNVAKSKLLEIQNEQITEELTLITNSLTDQGFRITDFQQYGLTSKQIEVIDLLRQGKTNKEIASVIGITDNAVKYHLKAVYDKMNIANRHEFFKFLNAINN